VEVTSYDPIRPFLFVGNALWLDFINTEKMHEGARTDLLTSYQVWVTWLVDAGVIEPSQADDLRKLGTGSAGEEMLSSVRDFRKSLRALAAAGAAGEPVTDDALSAINECLKHDHGYIQVVRNAEGFSQRNVAAWSEATDLLAPIAKSAADFLYENRMHLVRQCESPRCILYFYDNTKNHGRRWCSMAVCGNRVKAALHYEKSKKGK